MQKEKKKIIFKIYYPLNIINSLIYFNLVFSLSIFTFDPCLDISVQIIDPYERTSYQQFKVADTTLCNELYLKV